MMDKKLYKGIIKLEESFLPQDMGDTALGDATLSELLTIVRSLVAEVEYLTARVEELEVNGSGSFEEPI